VQIDLCTSSGGKKRVPYFQWTLENVRVTDYSVSATTDDDLVPTESMSLNYEKIKWTYDKMGKDGSSKGKVEASWNVEEGTA
jgi:type VI secretion system Hcp family effector